MYKISKIIATLGIVFGMFFATGYAPITVDATSQVLVVRADDEEADEKKGEYSEELKDATEGTYRSKDDTTISSEECWDKSENGKYYILKGDVIVNMTDKDQQLFYSRMNKRSQQYLDEQKEVENGVTGTTASAWWKEMSSISGVGAQYVQQLTSGIQVDLQAGQSFFKPLQGIIGTVLGIGCVAVMSFLVSSFLLDIFYITIPFFRMFMDGNGGQRGGRQGYGGGRGMSYGGGMGYGGGRGGAGQGPAYISNQAKNAVREEEGGRNALIAYFKSSVIKIVVLVLALMFLISGKIFVVIGWIMNIVASMFGFSSI